MTKTQQDMEWRSIFLKEINRLHPITKAKVSRIFKQFGINSSQSYANGCIKGMREHTQGYEFMSLREACENQFHPMTVAVQPAHFRSELSQEAFVERMERALELGGLSWVKQGHWYIINGRLPVAEIDYTMERVTKRGVTPRYEPCLRIGRAKIRKSHAVSAVKDGTAKFSEDVTPNILEMAQEWV